MLAAPGRGPGIAEMRARTTGGGQEAVTSRLGPHPEAVRLVADAVDDLVAHGLLRVEPG